MRWIGSGASGATSGRAIVQATGVPVPATVRAVRIGLAAVAAAFCASAVSAAPGQIRRPAAAPTGFERRVVADINAFRRAHGLRPLRVSAELAAAAGRHSQEMAADGYFAHSSADGTAFWRRIRRYYGSGSWPVWSVGENLLWSSPGVTPGRALRMWEDSPEHVANLLAARWREVGISAVHVHAAPGVFHGLDVTIVTADFGARR